MRSWCIALYGLFQVAIMFYSPLSSVFGQIEGNITPTKESVDLMGDRNYIAILQHIFGKTQFSTEYYTYTLDDYTEHHLKVIFGPNVSIQTTSGESVKVRVTNVYVWMTGGHVLQEPDEGLSQVLVQVLVRFSRFKNDQWYSATGDPIYFAIWSPITMQSANGAEPSVSDLTLTRNTYSLPCYLSNSTGFVLYPFNSAVFKVDATNILNKNSGKQITDFANILIGRNFVWPDPSVVQEYQFLIAHSVYEYATRGYYITENNLGTGLQGFAPVSAFKWPLKNYINANLSIGGAIEREGFPITAGQLDYDNGGQRDLSEWIVNKNRNDPSDDDKNQTDPEVNPPNTDWPEGQSVVDIGRDSFNRYENYWQVETGYYEPLQLSSNLGTLESEALTPFEKDDLELDDMPDVESKTQGLESQITEEIKKWQIYNDLQSLIQPFQATEPFKYEFEVSYEIPSLLNTGGVSPAQPSASATASASHSWAADTPKTIELGKFTLDFSIFTQNSTVNQYVTTIRTILHFIMAITVFIKIITMVKDAIIGGARGGVMGAAVLG